MYAPFAIAAKHARTLALKFVGRCRGQLEAENATLRAELAQSAVTVAALTAELAAQHQANAALEAELERARGAFAPFK